MDLVQKEASEEPQRALNSVADPALSDFHSANRVLTSDDCQGPSAAAQRQHQLGISAAEYENGYQVGAFSVSNSAAVDSADDRRKRRKVSVERNIEETNREVEPPVVTGVMEDVIDSHEASNHHSVPPPNESTPVSGTGTTPKKRRGRPPKANLSSKQNSEKGDMSSQTHDTLKGSTESKSKRTPRKKMLQINPDGTLSRNSPTSHMTESPPGTDSVRPKRVTKSRNLTVKNGMFMQSLVVKLKYGNDTDIGRRVLDILARPRSLDKNLEQTNAILHERSNGSSGKSTHPFFLSKRTQIPSKTNTDTANIDLGPKVAEVDSNAGSSKPVAWKDLVFASKPAMSKTLPSERALWPPHPFQHVGVSSRIFSTAPRTLQSDKQKSRARGAQVNDDPNGVLYSHINPTALKASIDTPIRRPQRLHCTSQEAIHQLASELGTSVEHPAVTSVRDRAIYSMSSFDRGEASGPLPWAQKYSPSTHQQVLQADCHVLHDWLRGLAVHNVKQGLDTGTTKKIPKKKKRPKRKDDELYGFIVFDLEDEEPDAKRMSNAILISGPNGCGKTASVYAVAKQLGFEVFEIHAGMRRSQKDIFDKVGDMTQNHIVQGGQARSRDSSVLNEPDASDESNQPSLTTFLTGAANKAMGKASRHGTPQPSKEQKQSLILFEDVDQVFEEDRSFWSGVQSLIQNSKRPVVLTCNDPTTVPIEELDLHTTLTYTPPSADLVTEYLTYIAIAEGHLIRPESIKMLYQTKRNDLRATMMELDFWCQMTVGSTKGGLDWYPQYKSIPESHGQKLRIFSKDTFVDGLDLMPTPSNEIENNMRFMDDCLQISFDKWYDENAGLALNLRTTSATEAWQQSRLASDFELMHSSVQPLLASTMCEANLAIAPSLHWLADVKKTTQTTVSEEERSSFFACLQPLEIEKPVFPPTQGRLAPSLDLPASTIATDIAPYVRSICAFDQRLEHERDELFSSQGRKTRTTKAARAAAEGGDKASTRRERWFPPNLDLRAVLETGNGWPQWFPQTNVIGDTGDSAQGNDPMSFHGPDLRQECEPSEHKVELS